MHTAIVRPIITYASAVWSKRTNLAIARNKLSKVQRLASIFIAGAMESCSTEAIKPVYLTSLYIVVENTSKRTAFKMIKKGTIRRWPNLPKLIKSRICTVMTYKKNTLNGNVIKWHTDYSKMADETGIGIHGPRAKYFSP